MNLCFLICKWGNNAYCSWLLRRLNKLRQVPSAERSTNSSCYSCFDLFHSLLASDSLYPRFHLQAAIGSPPFTLLSVLGRGGLKGQGGGWAAGPQRPIRPSALQLWAGRCGWGAPGVPEGLPETSKLSRTAGPWKGFPGRQHRLSLGASRHGVGTARWPRKGRQRKGAEVTPGV